MVRWRKVFYGWTANASGHVLTVQRYRLGNGKMGYVARVDYSAPTSPATAYRSYRKAQKVAEKFAEALNA